MPNNQDNGDESREIETTTLDEVFARRFPPAMVEAIGDAEVQLTIKGKHFNMDIRGRFSIVGAAKLAGWLVLIGLQIVDKLPR